MTKLIVSLAVLWLLGLALGYGGFYYRRHSLAARLTGTEQEIAVLQPYADRVAEKEEQTQRLTQLQQLVAENKEGRVLPLLRLMQRLTPTLIDINNFSYDQGRISFSCQSQDLESIGAFYTNMYHEEELVSLQFGSISRRTQGAVVQYVFTVSFNLEGGEEDE